MKNCGPLSHFTDQKLQSTIRERHETVNRRFKQFFALGHKFRHNLDVHSIFHAVANLTHLQMIDNPLFNTDL